MQSRVVYCALLPLLHVLYLLLGTTVNLDGFTRKWSKGIKKNITKNKRFGSRRLVIEKTKDKP